MNGPSILTVENIKKYFSQSGHTVKAVDMISFEVNKGEVFGLVGPDGAGKTTTIKMLCTVLTPDAGRIEIQGLNLRGKTAELRRRIGYLSQKFSLYGDLTVDENIDFFAEIHGLREYTERKTELLQFMRLDRFRDRLAQLLSGGMKQKLALTCTLIHTPAIIFLDEPTTGVDPVSRRDFWRILSQLQQEGLTIVISTPYLDEAERCHRVAFMDAGRILMCDSPLTIKDSVKDHLLEVTCSALVRASQYLYELAGVTDIQTFGDRLHLHSSSELSKTEVRRVLEQNGIEVFDVRAIMPSLEDAFIYHLTHSTTPEN